MTLPEYLYRMKASNLSRVDKEYDMHLQAWLNEQVSATKKQGKGTVPLYKSFDKFFNYEKRLAVFTGPLTASGEPKMKSEHKRLARIASKLNRNT